MGGWPLLAASISGQACGHAAAIRSTIHAGCAVSADRPLETTSSTARAAAASAGAPGAHGVLTGDFAGWLTGVPAKSRVLLAKAPPHEARTMGIVPGAHAPPARPLHLEHPESPLTALYEHEIIQYGDDRAWFVSFSLQFMHVRGMT